MSHDLGRNLNQRFSKSDMFIGGLFERSLSALDEHFRPFSFLLFFPEALLFLPIGSTITPKMEINVKLRSNHPSEAIDVTPLVLRACIAPRFRSKKITEMSSSVFKI